MSLLKWKEFAKSKTELGNKINYVYNLIKQNKIGEKTSRDSFEKVFKPVTTKLDDVVKSNLRMSQIRKRPTKKGEVPDYSIDIDDQVYPYEDMDVEGLIDYVPPQQDKQLPQEPPPYEPPKYDYNEEVDYTVNDEDLMRERLNELSLENYQDLEEVYNNPELTKQKKLAYYQKTINTAERERNRLKGSKSDVTKKFNKGEINEAMRQERNKKIDNDKVILTDYINFNKEIINELNIEKKGSGIRGRGRKQRGGNVMFFNNPNQLLKKLELIIGEILAGNTSIKMRNMGVNILDTLLKIATINRSQYNKIYNNYFKICEFCPFNVKTLVYVFPCEVTYNITVLYKWIERLYCHHEYDVKGQGNNTPQNFTTRFNRPIMLGKNSQYAVGLNRIINMSFTWFNVNPSYKNQSLI